MKTLIVLIMLLFEMAGMGDSTQGNLTVDEAHNFFNNSNILITYREGEAVYGTYYFVEIHYCPQGQYGLYGNSVKKTVLGNEQRGNWQEYGNWKVIKQNGQVGMHSTNTYGVQNFTPLYKAADGSIMINQTTTIVKQGQAICY